ncbi:MAG TPA: hypothetical protein VKU90_04045 [Caulobacteraceae bacterium]|nr:hypothetical protein [Caulobacteraceae bacterium]
MTSIVTGAGAMGDHARDAFQRDQERSAEPAEPAAPAAPQEPEGADVRLLIQLDPAEGGFVYTIVDRRSGAVVRAMPYERLLKLGETADYAAGALIKASV